MARYRTILTSDAELDIIETVYYYDLQQEGLSQRFLDELIAARNRLEQNPVLYGHYGATQFRAIPLKTFNFLLIYKVREDEIVIVSVRHTRRAPITD